MAGVVVEQKLAKRPDGYEVTSVMVGTGGPNGPKIVLSVSDWRRMVDAIRVEKLPYNVVVAPGAVIVAGPDDGSSRIQLVLTPADWFEFTARVRACDYDLAVTP